MINEVRRVIFILFMSISICSCVSYRIYNGRENNVVYSISGNFYDGSRNILDRLIKYQEKSIVENLNVDTSQTHFLYDFEILSKRAIVFGNISFDYYKSKDDNYSNTFKVMRKNNSDFDTLYLINHDTVVLNKFKKFFQITRIVYYIK